MDEQNETVVPEVVEAVEAPAAEVTTEETKTEEVETSA